ncbi:MAG: hypothetical protein FWC26_08555 [Fibromonadales bacterium]|nr:hypothetical protein [Fibromonadales bacterium]
MSEFKIAIASIMLAVIFANATDIDTYGFVRFNGVWSDGVKNGSETNGVSSASPVDTGGYGRGPVYERASRFKFAANQSTLGINMSDSTFEGRLVLTGKLEANFISAFNLQYGFINFSFPNIGLNILFGQTDILFVPYDPPTINYRKLVGMGNLYTRRPQIRITQKISSIEVAVAARENNGDYPAVEGRISTTGPIKIGTSAVWISSKSAGVSYIDYDHDEPDSYGLAADISADIGIVSISGEFFTGQNIKNYGGIQEYYYNRSTKSSSIGGWGALGFRVSDNLSINAGASVENLLDEYYWSDNGIWLNRAIFANMIYKVTPNATLALEYFRHDTEYNDDRTGSYNRVETAITYGF